ncbi:hypothetical protein [Crocosphaera watsonii]|uniref:hypothetical protein n=1 Tax=Crocosphaera watsonii TaxID=263511 RepID=UPI0030D6D0BF
MAYKKPLKIVAYISFCYSYLESLRRRLTKPEFLTKSAIAKHRSLTGSGFEQSDRRFPQPTVCCQILS